MAVNHMPFGGYGKSGGTREPGLEARAFTQRAKNISTLTDTKMRMLNGYLSCFKTRSGDPYPKIRKKHSMGDLIGEAAKERFAD